MKKKKKLSRKIKKKKKRTVTYKGKPIKLAVDFSIETFQSRRKWHDILKVLNGIKLQPRILYPARLSFRIEGEIKNFRLNKNKKLKCFVFTKPALQEIRDSLSGNKRPKVTA